MTKAKKTQAVVVFDIHRGIYFGYLVSTTHQGRTVKLKGARNCFRFPVAEAGHKGVYGLATIGPGESAKIGPRVTMTIHDVSKVVECTPGAVEKWERISW